MATAELTVGEAGTVDLQALVDYEVHSAEPIPDGMTFSEPGLLSGTPTTPGVTEVVCSFNDPFGNPTEVGRVTVTVVAAPLVVGVETSLDVWTLAGFTPEDQYNGPPDGGVPGLEWNESTRTLDGTPTESGEFTVVVWTLDAHNNDRSASVTVTVVGSEPDPEDPDPEDPEPGDPDPEDPDEPDELDPWELHERLARALGARVAAFVGQPGNPDVVATAEAQVPIVTEYVRGFTRGRGFRDESPAGPLRAVIVSGVARLATNPEQVAHFQTGDYSERPAQLAGWTLAELGVLHRYRRTTA